MLCKNCGALVVEGQSTCKVCGQVMQEDMPYMDAYGQNKMGMKWFKFIVNVQLIVSAIISIIDAFGLLRMAFSDSFSYSMLYSEFGGLKPLNIVTGLACIGLAIAAFSVRGKLKNFERDAFSSYIIYYIAQIVVSILYAFIAIKITDLSAGDVMSSDMLTNLIMSILMLAVNIVYLKKRDHLFIR